MNSEQYRYYVEKDFSEMKAHARAYERTGDTYDRSAVGCHHSFLGEQFSTVCDMVSNEVKDACASAGVKLR